ncbi:pentapeptide repeat-containing protein [Nocardia nova SH22a]|uniref:Pentapeptide repeat-containing protein n=1 Tax=Nocardia nova SH22a TaxID=1415166 RepID=W5TGN7_9NOCA|nr:pentapeptide repeat-containing protein [Nocardia nova]AHH18339.1 pentapeptide repeat-containing protein [Nocardia nova SH22a]
MKLVTRAFSVFAVVTAFLALVCVVYYLPVLLAPTTKDAETFRGQLVPLVSAAIAGAVAVYAIKKHYLDKDKQYTDSFSTAIGHLGSGDPFLRAGGARELARIMHYTPADTVRVAETYADFLRLRAGADSRPAPEQPPAADIAAVIGCLPRRSALRTHVTLDLRGVRIPRADLAGTMLAGALLAHADLSGADLRGADLTGADLTGANLLGADLTGSALTGANLTDARLPHP